jgi:DNA invertase Pin-like site-specific DNA recombinase
MTNIAKANCAYKVRSTSIDHNKIKQLKADGMGATAIAKNLGCSRGAVYKLLGSLGIY